MKDNNVDAQHKSGKKTATERVFEMLDEGSFVELDKYLTSSNAVPGFADMSEPGEGVIAGWGEVDGCPVYIFAQDYTVLKGSFGNAHARKICKVLDLAAKNGMPVICMWDSAGARIQEGIGAIDAYASVMKKLTDISGAVPTISVIAGAIHGTGAMLVPMTDFCIAIDKTSSLSMHSPLVLASNAGIDPDKAVLSAEDISKTMGIAHAVAKDETGAFECVKKLLSYIPSNNLGSVTCEYSEGAGVRPIDPGDVDSVIAGISDDGTFLELSGEFAKCMKTGFIRVEGVSVAVVANAGEKNICANGCKKAARFINFADAYSIPVLTIADNNGAVADIEKERRLELGDLASLAGAYAGATCPLITLITGRAVGEGYAIMSPKSVADVVFAYENATIACMDVDAGAVAMFGDMMKDKDDAQAARQEAADKYKAEFGGAMNAAKMGIVDEIIEPTDTRRFIVGALNMVINKRELKLPKKHGILPL